MATPLHTLRSRISTLRAVAHGFLVALCLVASIQYFRAQESRKPYSEKDIIYLLTNDVPPPRVAELARESGITFVMTATTEQTLRDSGATDSLIQTLRSLAPKQAAPTAPPSAASSNPPVLLIVSSPGESQVYIDDEPMGTTSPEGRLKLSKLGAGDHTVRVAHTGYTDFEQTVTLTSGPTSVQANLQASNTQPAPAANPPGSNPPGQQPNQAAATTPTASIGVVFRRMTEGAQGATVLALVPDGPAERAGIRPGYTVLSIAGQNIVSLQDSQLATAGRRPGQIVPVTFSNNGQVSTVRVTLASPSIFQSVPHFRVAHDHGPPAPNYCLGWMWIYDGIIAYFGQTGVNSSGYNGAKHNLEFPTAEIREVKKNGFYMAALGAFHIRMKNGNVANFLVVDEQGHYQRPDDLLAAAERATSGY